MALSSFGGITSFAETNETRYPEDGDFIKPLTFGALSDYAVNEERYAFAEKNAVTVYDGGNVEKFEFESDIISLDCSDGVFYCSNGETVYSLPSKEESDYEMKNAVTAIDVGDYNYRLTDKTLKIADYAADTVHTPEGEFSNLKLFGEKVYALSDGKVCLFTGETYTVISLTYYDYTVTQEIAVGNTASALINYKSLEFVTVTEGAHMTRIDLTEIDGEYFQTGETQTAGALVTALLLCRTGNAAVIAIGDDSYLVHESNVKTASVQCVSPAEFENATITGNNIYSSPYVIVGTPAMSDATGTIVKVVGKLEYEGVLGSVFYEVRYTTKNGSIKTGFVADGLLTEYIIEDNKDPSVVPDPDYTEGNNTKTVLLIFAVVILVLAAVAYLAYVGTKSGKKSKKKSKEKDKPEE